jgi:hypothetical protein
MLDMIDMPFSVTHMEIFILYGLWELKPMSSMLTMSRDGLSAERLIAEATVSKSRWEWLVCDAWLAPTHQGIRTNKSDGAVTAGSNPARSLPRRCQKTLAGLGNACGAPGPFLLSVGISSSYHIAKFFGIAVARPQAERNTSAERNLPQISTSPRLYQEAEPALDGEILDKDDDVFREHQAKPHVAEIGAVINKALRAAGLIKE